MLLSLITSALVLPGWVNLVLTILPILGFLGALFGWYQSYRKNRKEVLKEEEVKLDKERAQATELEARKQDYAQFKAKVEERMTGINLFIEGVAKDFQRECELIREKVKMDHGQTESKVDKLETRMDTRFSSLEVEVRGQTKLLNDILMGIADLGSLRKSK